MTAPPRPHASRPATTLARRPAHEIIGLRPERLTASGLAALALGFAAFWLLGRGYRGIAQDATVYLAQGLRQLDPQAFEHDLFFAFGSQDAFTAFPQAYALLIDALGPASAALAVTVLGQAAFVAAAWALIGQLVQGPARWWSLVLLAAVSGYYGGGGVFRIAEPFATARSLAEPMVIAALAGTLASRHGLAIALLACAAALHPLVAAPGIAAVFLWHAVERPRLLWAIAFAAAAVAALASAGALSWSDFALRFDAPWRDAVLDRSSHLFTAQWQAPDWSRIAWGLGLVWLAMRFVPPNASRLLTAAAVTAIAGIAASWMAVDLLASVHGAALQMWRAHWPLHAIAIMAAPAAIAGMWRSGNVGRAAAACVVASFCFGRSEQPAAAVLVVLSLLLVASERRWPGWMSERTCRAATVLSLCAASAGLLFEVQSRIPVAYGTVDSIRWTDFLRAAGSVGGILPLAALLWLAACSRFSAAGLALAAAMFGVSAAAWDTRTPWARFLEHAGEQAHPFRSVIAPNAQVFWPGDRVPAWQVLRRPAWYSVDQGAGIVFSRGTALEFAARTYATLDLRTADMTCVFLSRDADPEAPCSIELRLARALCERRDGPDYLVLHAPLAGRSAVEWRLPPEVGPAYRMLYLYACPDLTRRASG